MYKINPGKREQAMDILSSVLGEKNFVTYQTIESKAREIYKRLTPRLPFHGEHHPFHDVMPNTVILGKEAGIPREKMKILAPYSLLHDIGMDVVYNGHEEQGMRIARKILKDCGFSRKELREGDGIIMATKLLYDPKTEKIVQQPETDNQLQKLMCDGDLSNLAEHFLNAGFALQKELIMQLSGTMGYVPPKTVLDWYRLQLAFIKNHGVWFTDVANKLYNGGQERNIEDLKARIEELEEDPSKNQKFQKFLDMPFEEAWQKLRI